MLPRTTGASDSHKVMGIDCPSMNCEAAALKNGSRAETKGLSLLGNAYYIEMLLPARSSLYIINFLIITFNGMCERNSNCCKWDIAGHMA